MFPFTLDGPDFLGFYAALAAVTILAHWLWHRVDGSGDASSLDALTADPYRIACLRGGPDEALRLAVVNLVDRDLLTEAKGNGLRATLKAHPEQQRRRLDRVILERCQAAPMLPDEILADRQLRKSAEELDAELQQRGLLRSDAQLAALLRSRKWLLLGLAGLALARMAQALLAGRSNILFLALLTALVCVVILKLPASRLTGNGQRTLDRLRTLLKRLRSRADQLRPGGATNEAMLVAAVFGLHALPAAAFVFAHQTFPPPRNDSGGSGGSSDSGGSSCSSSGGSSDGGSSCGGGGGCGGCGGGGGD